MSTAGARVKGWRRRFPPEVFGVRMTAKGVGLLATGLVLLGVGWRFDIIELVGLAVSIIALVLFAVAALAIICRPFNTEVHRTAPEKLVCGQACPVVTKAAHWRPLTGAFMQFVQDRLATSLRPSAAALTRQRAGRAGQQISYRITPAQTGCWQLGPLEAGFGDPFGLAHSVATFGAATPMVVWPKTYALSVGGLFGNAIGVGTNLTPSADDATLRAYLPGDDLRRIHWPTSARRGAPMIRENENRGVSPVQVLLDPKILREPKHAEWALSHIASIACAALEAGHPVRILGAGLPEYVECQATGRGSLLNQIAEFATSARRLDLTTLTMPSTKRGVVTYAVISAADAPLPPALPGKRYAVLLGDAAKAQNKLTQLQAAGWRATHLSAPVRHGAALAALTGATTEWKVAA